MPTSDPKVTPTVLDAAGPFGSHRGNQTVPESDPPTALVRRDSFRELPPGSVVGEIYEIDAKLGSGAMGEVYAARHQKLGKRVAIKVIGRRLSEDAAAIERFAMEARTLAQIQHPSIVAVDHVGELPDGRAWFVMELLRGESLLERLARGPMKLAEALRVLDQMARGLDAAHGQGVIHRDLKPENTFLVRLPDEPPAVKILDFGLAKLGAKSAEKDRRAERTQSGVAIGTPMYMSPEQCRGPDVDHRTDIYALGCVAYELFLGRPPFPHARTAPELFAAHLHEAPPLPRTIWPEIPHQLDLVLFAMLAKNPAHRPTLAQVRSVLADVRMGTRTQRAPTEFVRAPEKRGPARNLTLAAIALGTLVVGITIGATLRTHTTAAVPRNEGPTIGHADGSPPDAAIVVPPTSIVSGPRLEQKVPVQVPAAPKQRLTPKSAPVPVEGTPAAPPDAGIDARAEDPPPSPETAIKPPTDRDQTVNPFKHKRTP